MRGDGDRPTERQGEQRARDVREVADEHRLDRDRYPWQFTVNDRFARSRLLGLGVTTNDQGKLAAVCVSPDYWEFDLATCKQIAFAWRGLCQRLEDEQDLQAQKKPGS